MVMDTGLMAMLRGSQCESVPFEHDLQGYHLNRSLVETCTRFLACMVDTQDYICQLKNTYVRELWPKICAEMAESNSRVIGLEKELADYKKAEEDSRRLHMQQIEKLRMANEDKRSHWVRVESLQHGLENEGRCESTAGRDPDHATNLGTRCMELEEQNQLLQQRIKVFEMSMNELNTGNETLRKQLQIETDEIAELKKALELARLKMQLQKQQRNFQEDSEDRYRRERRLSLKKQRRSQNKSGNLSGLSKGGQGMEDGSLKDVQPVDETGLLQSPASAQSIVPELQHGDLSVPDIKPPGPFPSNITYLAPGIKRIDLEVDTVAIKVKLAEDPKCVDHETVEIVRRPTSEENATGGGTVVESRRLPRSSHSKAANCCTAETRHASFESDKIMKGAGLTLGSENPKSSPVLVPADRVEVSARSNESLEQVSAEIAKEQLSTSCSPRSRENMVVSGPVELAAVFSRELASPTRAKQCSSVERGLIHKTKVSETSANVPSKSATCATHNSTGKKTKERKWRQTRSRTEEAGGDDLHDSFLNTPREMVMANLKSRGNSVRIQQEESQQSPSAELRKQGKNKGSGLAFVSLNRVRKETDSAAAYEWTDDCELKDKQSVGTKASAEKSAERAEKTVKSSRPSSSAARTSTDKERQASSSRTPGYKFNEPVRKKREREQLEATDCQQCRKFYDAVLAEDAEGVTMDRCEHHDVVSRHRYKYLPPGTPTGFWNIGFDSEI